MQAVDRRTQVAPPLRLAHVSKNFGPRIGLRDVSLTLEKGSVTGLLGPNGAGKTTALRCIGGLLRPSAGSVELFGALASRPQARASLGYMPADPRFADRLTGHENLDLLAALRGRSVRSERMEVAEALGLSAGDLDVPLRSYSSGMRQKLAIIAAFQHNPGLVVLDEPANRLDPIAHHAFCDVVRQAAHRGTTVLLSSHVLGEVEEVCATVAMMRAGSLLQISAVEDLRQHASRRVTMTFGAPPFVVPNSLVDPLIEGVTLTGQIPARRPDIVRALLDQPDLVDLVVEPASLEDMFLRLYGRHS